MPIREATERSRGGPAFTEAQIKQMTEGKEPPVPSAKGKKPPAGADIEPGPPSDTGTAPDTGQTTPLPGFENVAPGTGSERNIPPFSELDTFFSRGTQTPEVKALFRQGARLFHPDLGDQNDPIDVNRRTAFMQAAIDAFTNSDTTRLQDLIDKFQTGWATPDHETVFTPPPPGTRSKGRRKKPPPPPYVSTEAPRSPIEMPEIVELGKAVFDGTDLALGVREQLKRDDRVRGYFSPTRGIQLRADVAKDPEAAAQVVAHEIGHAIDWLEGTPGQTLRRGNILGSLAALHRFMRGEFEGYRNKALRNELIRFSTAWKPFDPNENAAYTRYRYSSRELYADFISGLFNAPAWTQTVAPRTFDAFFHFLDDKKPRVRRLYDGIQNRIHNSGAISQRRRERVAAMFSRGEAARRARAEARQGAAFQGFTDFLAKSLIDKDHAILQPVRAAEKAGEFVNPEDNPRYWMERLRYGRGKERAWMAEIERVHSTLEEAEIDPDDFGAILFHERVVHERGEFFNPEGFTPDTSREQLNRIELDMGSEKWAHAQDAVQSFRAAWEQIRDRMEEAFILSQKGQETLGERDFYATFNVLHHFEAQEGPRSEFGIS
ncbi:MAG: hypothetical protein ACYTEQ_30525, partial [Planctomycetota bacterium]